MIDFLIENGLVNVAVIFIAAVITLNVIRTLKEASNIDIKKSKREHSRYQLDLLKALRELSGQDSLPTLLPATSDPSEVKVLKEEFWRSHKVSVASIEAINKEHEKRTLMPITAIKSFVKGKGALEISDDKVTAVKYNNISTIFIISAIICYIAFLFLVALGINNWVAEGQRPTAFDFYINLLSVPFALSFLIAYASFGRFKANLNAKRFLNLVKPSYEIDGLK